MYKTVCKLAGQRLFPPIIQVSTDQSDINKDLDLGIKHRSNKTLPIINKVKCFKIHVLKKISLM